MLFISLFKSRLLFIIFLLVLFFGLFVLNAMGNETRIKHELWNASHYLVFFVFWLFMTNLLPWLRPLDFKRVLLILTTTFIVSAGIEWLQSKVGRTASWGDVQLSIAGSLAVIGVYIYDLTNKKVIAYANVVLIVILSLVMTWPSLKIFIDEFYIAQQVPVLSDFSTPYEETRWKGSFSNLSINSENSTKGLKVELKPGHWYSTVEFRSFYRDWTGYNKLIIEIDNLENTEFNASIRIHDKEMQSTMFKHLGFTPEEAKILVGRLNSGALPIGELKLLSTQTIGASLGEEAVGAGVQAGVWGLLFIAFFLIFWYRLPGLLAVIALGIYVATVLALFKLIPVTLTAAGVAGFVLSVGMAVDANILIFERMKEELRGGRNIRDAIREGFSRAWLSIRDGNTSSIITAVILFWFGSSLIEGFALTFGLGIIISMLSAIVITRTFLFAVAKEENEGIAKFLFGTGIK